ncbi:hypothetical protein JW979_11050 [bacterium]|nr:hypothetical protein [candidate division CSSED10-310 bacterium]
MISTDLEHISPESPLFSMPGTALIFQLVSSLVKLIDVLNYENVEPLTGYRFQRDFVYPVIRYLETRFGTLMRYPYRLRQERYSHLEGDVSERCRAWVEYLGNK